MTTRTLFLTSLVAVMAAASATFPLSAQEDSAVARQAQESVVVPEASQISTNTEAEIRKTQEAIEKLRGEIEARTAQHSEAITASLRLIESSMNTMHERHMEAVQSSNRAILTVAGIFAAVGIIGIIFILVVLARALGRFSEIAVANATRPQLIAGGANAGLLGAGDAMPARQSSAEEASARFQSAIEQLQKRILELEHSAQSGASNGSQPATLVVKAAASSNIQPLMPEDAAESAPETEPPGARATVLLGKGQALLNLDATEPAMECFNEVLDIDPTNAEALVKRGLAFEKLQDWERALENYDRAIAADNSMTVAYLYRGGVCNRLQRYREALESYEQALRTEKTTRAS